MGKLVGARYAIVGEVYAYGITEGSSAGKVGFVELLPPPGIRDPKVAFKRLVPQGETFRVIGVRPGKNRLNSTVTSRAPLVVTRISPCELPT